MGCGLCGNESTFSTKNGLCKICAELIEISSVKIEDACLMVRCLHNGMFVD